ncbi:MAG: LOG family protein [Candidatus Blackburnbacteria bacterium]|nr:LOG family protein [Candidatus Blackburnbacteria bacterium]
MEIKNVTFLGYSGCHPGEELYQNAFDAAACVAKEGYVVVNGGGPGVMRASTEGAKSVGGQAIGITFYPKDMTFFEGHDPGNNVDELIETNSYLERTLKLLDYGDIFVVFNGGTGTISEFGMAWGLARLYFGHHKPLILFGGFWYPIIEEIAQHMKLRQEELEVYKIITEVDHIVPAIKEFEDKLSETQHNHQEENPFTT